MKHTGRSDKCRGVKVVTWYDTVNRTYELRASGDIWFSSSEPCRQYAMEDHFSELKLAREIDDICRGPRKLHVKYLNRKRKR